MTQALPRSSNMAATRLAPLLLLTVALVLGCGDGRPTRVPVAGQVVIDGEPVRFGMIKLCNANTRAASSRLDSEGRFQLTCFEKHDGVIPGTHQVEVSATEGIDDRTTRWHAPKKYADKHTSGIEVTIDEPKDDLIIELSWDGKKGPFVERQQAERAEETRLINLIAGGPRRRGTTERRCAPLP